MSRSQWVNIDDDGALPALLRRIASRIAPASIDSLWIFPTRRGAGAESTVIALSVFDEDRTRRRVGTVHFLVTRDRKGNATIIENLDEYASAPPDAVPRIIDGVTHRLEHAAASPPGHERIGGDPARWDDLLARLADPEARGGRATALLDADPAMDGG
jgi:hypothetical protein